MRYECFYDGTYASNCYLVMSDDESVGVIIDPSVSYDFVFRQRHFMPKIEKILLTHAHFDHVLKLQEWREKTGAEVCITALDAPSLADGYKNAYSFFFGGEKSYGKPDILLNDNDSVRFGDGELSVMLTAGHTAGSCCYVGDNVIFTGDTIFADGGFGRTDLYSGSARMLTQSILKLLSLDKDYVICSGHGGESTLGQERQNHRFNI